MRKMRTRWHLSYGHGLTPGTDHDMLCPSCKRERAEGRQPDITGEEDARTDAEWLYGNSPAGLRRQAAEELAAEFGSDVEEWLV